MWQREVYTILERNICEKEEPHGGWLSMRFPLRRTVGMVFTPHRS
jgi:hypothetical protein